MCLRQRLASKKNGSNEVEVKLDTKSWADCKGSGVSQSNRSEEYVNERCGEISIASVGGYLGHDGRKGHQRRYRRQASIYAHFWRKMGGRVIDFMAGAISSACLFLLVLSHRKTVVDDATMSSTQDNSSGSHIGSSFHEKQNDLSDKYEKFLMPELKPGQAETLKWEDGSVVQKYATRVGLPPQLVPTLTKYAKDMGLYDIMTDFLYEQPIQPGKAMLFDFQSPYQEGVDESDRRNFTWNVERPDHKWHSDAHWFNTADELSHEDALRALAKGRFDEVIKGIGEAYDLSTLHVDSVGFMAITNCDAGYIHTDFRNVDGRGYNLLFEISSPEDIGPELIVEGDNGEQGQIKYSKDVAWVNGDGTRHGTALCDYRPQRGVRISATVFLLDASTKNLGGLLDTSSMFPPKELNEKYVWAQRGRHWRKGGGPGLKYDKGRAALEVEDSRDNCTKDDCIFGPARRNTCLKTCVFMDDSSQYKPGMERQELFGY